MTWLQQIAALKRQLSGKSKSARSRRKKRAQKKCAAMPEAAPVTISGNVSQAFADRMRASGVRVIVKR